jgi:hypothetical protein
LRERQGISLFCTYCGKPIETSDRFCTWCAQPQYLPPSQTTTPAEIFDLTSAVQNIRKIRACSAIPVLLGITLAIMSPLPLFAGTRDWPTFGRMISSGAALIVLGRFVARGWLWAVSVVVLLSWLTAFAGVWGSMTGLPASEPAGTIAGMIALCVFICWLTARGLVAALRHRRFFKSIASRSGSSKKRPLALDNRLWSAVKPFTAALAVYVSGVPFAIVAGAVLPVHGLGAGLVYLPFAVIASRLYVKAQQLAALRVAEIRKLDTRGPVLFIRSFSDDSLPLDRQAGIVKFFAPTTLTLEECVVNRSWAVGPVIAVGKPKEDLGPLGAAREYLEGDVWRDRVEHLMNESQFVISVLGSTGGLLWEYQSLLRFGLLSKLLVVFPPLPLPAANRRWQLFRQALSQRDPLPPLGVAKPIAAVFPKNGPPLLFACRYQNEIAYRMALDAALSHMEG